MARETLNYNDISKIKDITTLNLLKESFDKDFDKQKKIVENLELAHTMSLKGFGYIKEAMEALSNDLFKTKEGRAILGRYINCVKESNELKKMHLLFECVRKANKDVDVYSYINEATSMIGNVDAKKYHNDTMKLGKILGEACLYLGKERVNGVNYIDNTLCEAIDFVGTHKKTPKTLAEYTEHCQIIKEHVSLHETQRKQFQDSSKKESLEKSIDEFNKKYGDELNENEQNLVKELLGNGNKEEIFERYKTACVNKLQEKQNFFNKEGDTSSSERIGIIMEKVSQKKYNCETVNSDVFNLIEITGSLE